MSGIPYLGSKISLISKSEIRYEGILVDVNPQESTITFEQVRFFGTEGRRPGDEIAPMDKVFDCVVFRSADIKDLQVYETAAAEEQKKQQQQEFLDPAVVSFASSTGNNNNSSSNQSGGFQYKSKSSQSVSASVATEEVKKVNDYASAAASQQQSQSHQNQNQQTKSFSTRNRSSTHSNNNFYHRQSSRVVVPESEFDFSQANAKFSKDEIIASGDNFTEEQHVAPSYNKNLSFFDDISCQSNTESSSRNRNDRDLNMETFGQAAPPRRYGHRGGRGSGRGYHRGGGYHNRGNNYYNNKNSNNNNNNIDN